MKRFNVVTKRTYTPKNSTEEKVQWNTIGSLIEFEEGKFGLELNMYPDTKFFVFDQKPVEKTEDQKEDEQFNQSLEKEEYTGADRTLEDIPF